MRLLVLILVAAVSAGCTQGEGLGPLAGADEPREPHFEEHRAALSPDHDVDYPFAVDAGASLVNVTLLLETWRHGLPLPGESPAQVRIALVDAAGTLVEEAVLDGTQRTASLVASAPSAAGTYHAQVRGFGLSQPIEGDEYGAAYRLTIEVAYG